MLSVQRKRILPLCLLVVVLCACIADNDPVPSSPVVKETPMNVSPARFIEIGIAATQSYKETFDAAKEKIASAIDSLVQINSGKQEITVRLLKGGSFVPDPKTDVIIDIPVIPADPAPPVPTPPPTSCSGDPFACSDEEMSIREDNERKEREYREKLRKNHAYLAEIKRQVRVKTEKVRSLKPAFVDTKDLWGFTGAASKRFQHVDAQIKKQLILATDFESIAYDQFIEGIVIPEVDVSIIYRLCGSQPICEEGTNLWRERFLHAHARSFSCFDPIESERVDLFS